MGVHWATSTDHYRGVQIHIPGVFAFLFAAGDWLVRVGSGHTGTGFTSSLLELHLF